MEDLELVITNTSVDLPCPQNSEEHVEKKFIPLLSFFLIQFCVGLGVNDECAHHTTKKRIEEEEEGMKLIQI